jgi:hypothetical protein
MNLRRLLCLCFLFVSTIPSFAQTGPEPDVPHIRLGNLTPSESDGHRIDDRSATTRAQILSNNTLQAQEPGYHITGFTFSIMPQGGEFVGPFQIKGDKLTPDNLALINKYPDAVIYFEKITYDHKGQAAGTARGCYYKYH